MSFKAKGFIFNTLGLPLMFNFKMSIMCGIVFEWYCFFLVVWKDRLGGKFYCSCFACIEKFIVNWWWSKCFYKIKCGIIYPFIYFSFMLLDTAWINIINYLELYQKYLFLLSVHTFFFVFHRHKIFVFGIIGKKQLF